MSSDSVATIKLNDKAKNEEAYENYAQPIESAIDIEENTEETEKTNDQPKLTEAQFLKSIIYNDLDELVSDVVKKDVNSDQPIKVVMLDYGVTNQRNQQWVQYMKPEIITRSKFTSEGVGAYLIISFFMLLFCFLITGGSGALVLFVTPIKDFILGQFGLCLIPGAIFLFLLSVSIMLSSCSRNIPTTLLCFIFLVSSSSAAVAVVVANTGGVEILLSVAVITTIVFLFWLLSCIRVNFTKNYLYVCVVTLVLGLFSLGVFVVTYFLDKQIVLSYTLFALLFSIYYVICILLQAQMILGGKGIDLDTNEYLYGALSMFISGIFVFINILQMISQYNLI